MTPAPRTPRAFSLVELVIVLAIAAVLAAIAIPRFSSAGERYRASLAAELVSRDILHAREIALAHGATQDVVFTKATISYAISGMRDPDNTALTYSVVLSRDPFLVTKLDADFGGSSTLTFNAFGVPASGGTVTLAIGNSTVTVTVAAGTGAVSH